MLVVARWRSWAVWKSRQNPRGKRRSSASRKADRKAFDDLVVSHWLVRTLHSSVSDINGRGQEPPPHMEAVELSLTVALRSTYNSRGENHLWSISMTLGGRY